MAIPRVLIEEEKEHIRKILPLLLKKDPEFRKEIYVILSKIFPIREELDELPTLCEKKK